MALDECAGPDQRGGEEIGPMGDPLGSHQQEEVKDREQTAKKSKRNKKKGKQEYMDGKSERKCARRCDECGGAMEQVRIRQKAFACAVCDESASEGELCREACGAFLCRRCV